MEARRELAAKKFKEGYNCCQAVACAYCEEFGISEKDMFRLTEGMGSGIGGLKDTCGAVMGMFLIISLANSAGDMENPRITKMDTYTKIQEAANAFREKNRSLYCRDLKNINGPQPLVCCMDCVKDAATWLDRLYADKEV